MDFVGLTNADVWDWPFWDTPWRTLSPEGEQRLKEAIAEAAKGSLFRYEVDNTGIGGRVVTLDFSIKPLRDEKGDVRFLITEGRDISERKLAEAALKRSEARYRAIVEDQTELISRFSPSHEITFVNGAYCRYFVEIREEILGRKFWHHLPPEDQEKLRSHIESLNRDNPTATIEHRALTANGKLRWLKWTDRTIFKEQNEIVEYQAGGKRHYGSETGQGILDGIRAGAPPPFVKTPHGPGR